MQLLFKVIHKKIHTFLSSNAAIWRHSIIASRTQATVQKPIFKPFHTGRRVGGVCPQKYKCCLDGGLYCYITQLEFWPFFGKDRAFFKFLKEFENRLRKIKGDFEK